MSDREALLNAIYANLDEDTPRLMYADWLDENGDGDQAAFLRAFVETRKHPAGSKEHRAAVREAWKHFPGQAEANEGGMADYCDQGMPPLRIYAPEEPDAATSNPYSHDERFRRLYAALTDDTKSGPFRIESSRRGFASGVTGMEMAELPLKKCFEKIGSVMLYLHRMRDEEFCGVPTHAQEVQGLQRMRRFLRNIQAGGHAGNLKDLDIYAQFMPPEMMADLFNGNGLAGLQQLRFTGPLPGQVIGELCEYASLPNLRALELPIITEDVNAAYYAFIQSSLPENLRSLKVRRVPGAQLAVLTSAHNEQLQPKLRNLKRLDIEQSEISEHAFRTFLGNSGLAGLEHLIIRDTYVSDWNLQAMLGIAMTPDYTPPAYAKTIQTLEVTFLNQLQAMQSNHVFNCDVTMNRVVDHLFTRDAQGEFPLPALQMLNLSNLCSQEGLVIDVGAWREEIEHGTMSADWVKRELKELVGHVRKPSDQASNLTFVASRPQQQGLS